jgi:hypothetical protein
MPYFERVFLARQEEERQQMAGMAEGKVPIEDREFMVFDLGRL